MYAEKAELYLELFGNTLIRQPTLQYLQDKANLFIEMITDLDYSDERMPTIDMSQLKVCSCARYFETLVYGWARSLLNVSISQ